MKVVLRPFRDDEFDRAWAAKRSLGRPGDRNARRRFRRRFERSGAFRDGFLELAIEVDGRLVGGSGWSASGRFHPPGSTGSFGHTVESGTATMRATYVDPGWTRRGFASLLARVTATAATIAGFRRFEALCTPMSEAVRLRLGYHVHERVKVPILGDVHWDAAVMRKELAPPR